MKFTLDEKKAIALAMKSMIDADNYQHPNEKFLFNHILKIIATEQESASIMAFIIDASILPDLAFEEHKKSIKSMSLNKKRDFISILTALAIVDGNIDKREIELILHYRLICNLSNDSYSMQDAMENAKIFITK